MEELITLYRPVGRAELEKIRKAGSKAFPPRLSGQPIFYPVLTYEYAAQIARDWNTKDRMSGFVGYVTMFRVRADFLRKYDVKTVGGARHREYWIPAEDLGEFNANIVGHIEVVGKFLPEDEQPGLRSSGNGISTGDRPFRPSNMLKRTV